jgi:chemosensory pili system protein ChpA (sensor histidine kinase/response regulator)
VSVGFRDDGAGLNLPDPCQGGGPGAAAADDELSDAEAANLIFMPGFSTAPK